MIRKVVIFGFLLPAAVLSAEQLKSQDGKRSLFSYSQSQGLPSQILYRNDIVILKDGTLLNGTLESLPALQYNFGKLPLSIDTVVIFASVPNSQGKWMAQTEQGRRYVATISENTVDFVEILTDQHGTISRKLRKIPINKVDFILMKPRGGAEPHTAFHLTFSNGDEVPVNLLDKQITVNDGKKKRVINTMDIVEVTFNGGIQGTLLGSDGKQVPMGLVFVDNPHISVIMSDNRGTLRLPWKNISQISKSKDFHHQKLGLTPANKIEPNQVIMAKGEIRIPEIDFLHEMKPKMQVKGEIEIAAIDFIPAPEARLADGGEIAEIDFNEPCAIIAANEDVHVPESPVEERSDFDEWLKELESASHNEVIAYQEDLKRSELSPTANNPDGTDIIEEDEEEETSSSGKGTPEKDMIFISQVKLPRPSRSSTQRRHEQIPSIASDPANIVYESLVTKKYAPQMYAAGEDFDLPDGVLDAADDSTEKKTETKKDPGGEIDFITKANNAKRRFLTTMKDEQIPEIAFIQDSGRGNIANKTPNQLLAAGEDFVLPEGIIDTLDDDVKEGGSGGKKDSRADIEFISKGKVEQRRYFTSLRDEQIPTIDFIKDPEPVNIAYESAAKVQRNQLFAAIEDFELSGESDDTLDVPGEEPKGSEKDKESGIDFISVAESSEWSDVIAMDSGESSDEFALTRETGNEIKLELIKSKNKKAKQRQELEQKAAEDEANAVEKVEENAEENDNKTEELPTPPATKAEKEKVSKKSFSVPKQQLKKELPVVQQVQVKEINPYEGMIYVKPANQRNAIGFYIHQKKVTNKEYKQFVDAVNYKPPAHWVRGKIPPELDNKPVVNISYKDAFLYSVWIGKRLPTEQELFAASENEGTLADNEDILNEWTSTPHVPGEDQFDENAVASARVGSAFASGHVIFGRSNPRAMKNTDFNAQTGFRLAAFAQ